jgi:hypothetical protein
LHTSARAIERLPCDRTRKPITDTLLASAAGRRTLRIARRRERLVFCCYLVGMNGRIFQGSDISAKTLEDAAEEARRSHFPAPGRVAVELWVGSDFLARIEKEPKAQSS